MHIDKVQIFRIHPEGHTQKISGEFEVFLDIWEGRHLVGQCETEPKDEQGISSYSVQTCCSPKGYLQSPTMYTYLQWTMITLVCSF